MLLFMQYTMIVITGSGAPSSGPVWYRKSLWYRITGFPEKGGPHFDGTPPLFGGPCSERVQLVY